MKNKKFLVILLLVVLLIVFVIFVNKIIERKKAEDALNEVFNFQKQVINQVIETKKDIIKGKVNNFNETNINIEGDAQNIQELEQNNNKMEQIQEQFNNQFEQAQTDMSQQYLLEDSIKMQQQLLQKIQ